MGEKFVLFTFFWSQYYTYCQRI